jgi:DNA ligase-1
MTDMRLLSSLQSLQNKLRTTSSSLEKQKILKTETTTDIKKLFSYIYNSNINFHITSKIVNKVKHIDLNKNYSLFDLLDVLSNKIISGHNSVYAVQDYIQKYPKFRETILNIIDKDLKIGININQINKIFPDLINIFSVALADKYDSKLIKNDKWFISRKLDGVRCICIIKNHIPTFFSRQGKEFFSLNVLKNEFEKLNINNIVFDGEIAVIHQTTENNFIEDFTGIMKEIRKKDHTIQNPKYFIFDTMTIDEFYSGISVRTFSQRLLNKIDIQSKFIEYLSQYEYNEEIFLQMQKDVNELKWEGLILRKDTIYKGKRSKDILKVKTFHDDEFLVKNIECNTIRQYDQNIGNYINIKTLGAVVIDYKGFEVSVGSGFSMDQRNEFYKNPEKIIGQYITVQYFEETIDKKGNLSLRFPTFKSIYQNV